MIEILTLTNKQINFVIKFHHLNRPQLISERKFVHQTKLKVTLPKTVEKCKHRLSCRLKLP